MGSVTHSNLQDVFTYHAPKGDFQIEKYHRLRQGARKAAQAILDGAVGVSLEESDPRRAQFGAQADSRALAIEEFGSLILREVGDCRDRQEALGQLQAAHAFLGGVGVSMLTAIEGRELSAVEADTAITQAVIQAIRGALMWANASVALEGRV